METKNIKFTERVSDIVARHNWNLTKASFLGFALLTVNGKKEAVCLLVEPGGYKYHRMDGSCVEEKGRPQFEVMRHYKHKNRIFSFKNLFVVIRADGDCVFWEVNSTGGVSDAAMQTSGHKNI